MSLQLDAVRKYINLVETLNFTETSTAGLLHADYLQWELPNQLNRTGQKSDAKDSFARMQTAQKILEQQHYELTSLIEHNNQVVAEAIWTANMAIEAGPFKKGQQLKAYFCMIFEFKEGKIYRIRNYDCFEPF